MQETSMDQNEAERLAALHRLELTGTKRETAFDRLVFIAAQAFRTPIAAVTLIDADQVWYKAHIGIIGVDTAARAASFCRETIRSSRMLVVEDLAEDERFRGDALVIGAPFMRFYAGVALTEPDGYRVGTLCVMDTKIHLVTATQGALLVALGADASELLGMRVASLALRQP